MLIKLLEVSNKTNKTVQNSSKPLLISYVSHFNIQKIGLSELPSSKVIKAGYTKIGGNGIRLKLILISKTSLIKCFYKVFRYP